MNPFLSRCLCHRYRGVFVLKLPQRLLAALDAKSAEIADELDEARKLREEAEACSPIMKPGANLPNSRPKKL